MQTKQNKNIITFMGTVLRLEQATGINRKWIS